MSSTATPQLDLSPAARAGRIGAIGFPTKRDEAWRYAPVGELSRLQFGPSSGSAADVPPDVVQQIPAVGGHRIVIVNGTVHHGLSDLDGLPAGLSLSPLAVVLDEQPDLVGAHFGAGDDQPADAFVALNRAFGGDGAVVRVEAGLKLDTPIHIVDIELPDESQNASCTGVVIDLGTGSSATVVETRIGGGGGAGGSNIRTTVTLAAGATLDHIILQDVPAAQIHLSRTEVTQAEGSELRARSFNLGARYGRIAYEIRLAGVGARTDLSGLYFGLGEQTLDHQLMVIHDAADCTSRQSFRGVLDDASTGVFSGGIDVRPGADGTDAEQSNDNLLLSDRAEVNTQPRLEILADEVACAHGATVGQLDETALYYMRSRGIPAEEARRLLISGFADQAVEDVGIEVVRAWITERLGHAVAQIPVNDPSVEAHQDPEHDREDNREDKNA